MTNLNANWSLVAVIVIALSLTIATISASPILAVKKSSSPSIKTTHKASPTKSSTTPTAHHISGVKLLSVHIIPSKVIVGNTFSVGGSVLNNSSATITFANGTCGASPLSIKFNKNVVPESRSAATSCKAQLATLKPGERSQIIQPNLSGIIYRATAPGMTNATMIFKYAVETPTSKSPTSDTYSRTYAFVIQPSGNQPAIPNTNSSPTSPATTSRNLLH
jgi:hypothetical protein